MLTEARQQIARYFPGAPLALEITIDPEALDNEQLIAIIITSVSADEAFECLDQLDQGWWLGVIRQASCLSGLIAHGVVPWAAIEALRDLV